MEQELKKVSITVQFVNYKTKKYLIKAIKTLLLDIANEDLFLVISILDNNSEDLSEIKNYFINSSVPINIYYSKENLGFGRGHNYLAAKANSDYILIANPDIELIQADTIKRMLAGFSTENIKIVGPKLINSLGKNQIFDHGEASGFLAKLLDFFGESYWQPQFKEIFVNWIAATFLLIKKDAFKEVKGFDENFFLYQEDEDLCLRIRDLGYKILYIPSIQVLHHGSVVASFSPKFMEPSKRYYLKKRFESKFRYLFLQVYLFLRYKIF